MRNIIYVLATAIALMAGGANAAGQTDSDNTATAIFAGGCFWCMEPPFDKLDGVLDTTSGYIGGHLKNPTYKQVSAGNSGHYEAVQVTYNPSKVSYNALLQTYWHNIDPVDDGGQFCDRGHAYYSAIFYQSPAQEKAARASKKALDNAGTLSKPIATHILAATTFYPAEDYHQNYYKKNPVRYKFYRFSCGRDGRLEELWGDNAGQ